MIKPILCAVLSISANVKTFISTQLVQDDPIDAIFREHKKISKTEADKMIQAYTYHGYKASLGNKYSQIELGVLGEILRGYQIGNDELDKYERFER